MIAFPLPIIGTKVLVRKLNTEDLKPLYELEIDKDVKRYVGGPVTKSQDEWIEGMRTLCSCPCSSLPLIVALRTNDEFVGRASLSPRDAERQCVEIQVLIAKKHWGQHLGREVAELLVGVAFDHLKAFSIFAIVSPDNNASRTLFGNLGFINVGTNQSDRWDNGHLIFRRELAR